MISTPDQQKSNQSSGVLTPLASNWFRIHLLRRSRFAATSFFFIAAGISQSGLETFCRYVEAFNDIFATNFLLNLLVKGSRKLNSIR